MKLNKFELLAGAIFGLAPVFWLRWWVLLSVPVCAFLWAWTGAGNGAAWRKVVMPILVFSAIFAFTGRKTAFLGLPLAFLALAQGYGIPSTQPPDPGSPLGRFWYSRTKGKTEKEHQDIAEFFTRLTIYAALAASFIPAFF